MAKKIEVVISANEQASNKIKGFNKTLATTQKIADATGSSYDRMSALSNRLQLNTLRLADAQRRLAVETDPMKQAQLRVEIDNLAHSQDALQKEIHESSDAMSKMGDSSQGVKVLGLSLTDLRSGIQMVTGAARTMMEVSKAAFDFTEEGASVIQTRQSFERLGVSIEAMREVSLNTIDDMTLMKATLTLTAGASEALQAELLDNAPALLRIAKAANAVNPGLGTTAQMYESISTGIKRASPLILDNLGIVVKVNEANVAYAKTLGITVEEMSAADRQLALLNATLEAGDRLIEQAGGTVESYGDAWAQLRVEIKNASDEIKAQSAEALGPLIRNYIKFLKLRTESGRFLIGLEEQFRGLNLVLAGNERAMDRVDITWKLATLQFQDASDLMQRLEDDIAGITVKEEQSGNATKVATEKLSDLNDEREREIEILKRIAGQGHLTNTMTSNMSTLQEENAWRTMDSAAAFDQYNKALEENEKMLEGVYIAQYNARQELERAERLAYNQSAANRIAASVRSQLTKKLEEGASTLADLRREQEAVNAEIEKLTASHGRAITVQSKATMTAAEAALATLQLADAQARLAEEEDPLKAAQLVVQIERMQEKLGGASEATTTFINNTKKIDELQGKYSGLAGEIDDVSAAIAETVKSFMIAQIQSQFAIDGWTDAEVKVFTDTAVAFGFMDEQHAKLITKIGTVNKLIDEVGETEEEAMANTGRATNALLAEQRRVTWEYTRIGAEGTTAIDSLQGPTDRETERMKLLFLETEENVGEFETLGLNAPLDLQKVEIAAGHAVEQLREIKNKAEDAQGAIDEMEGKSITVDIHINTHGSGKGVFAGDEGATSPRDIIEQQHGGDYMVNRPTMFIAGEGSSPERALFIPQGRPGFDGAVASQAFGKGGGTSIGELNIFVNGSADAHETAQLVIMELKGRGLMPQTPLR